MMPATRRVDTRLLTAVRYRPSARSLAVVYDDGEIVDVSVETLKLPDDAKIQAVRLDDFQRGIEFVFADGTMHDVAADYIIWLTDESYRRQYPDEDIGPRIGANVAALRAHREMSQGELARAAGIQGPNLSRLESGKHVPTLDVLLRVAHALKVPLTKIVGLYNLDGDGDVARKERQVGGSKRKNKAGSMKSAKKTAKKSGGKKGAKKKKKKKK